MRGKKANKLYQERKKILFVVTAVALLHTTFCEKPAYIKCKYKNEYKPKILLSYSIDQNTLPRCIQHYTGVMATLQHASCR